MHPANKRRNYFINKEVQLRFTALLVFISLLTSLQLLGYLAFIDQNLVEKASRFGLNKDDVSLSFMLIEQRSLLIKLLICLVANMVLVGIFGLLFSHRIAGPVYRMEKFFKGVAEGDLSGVINLRKKDQFQSFAATINLTMECLRQKRRDELASLKLLSSKLQNLSGAEQAEALKIVDSLSRQCEADLYSRSKTPPPTTA